jgi:protein-S-isoprenylcysteine O-methyltransferase Ste14
MEKRFMLQIFGEQYLQYRHKVKGLPGSSVFSHASP